MCASLKLTLAPPLHPVPIFFFHLLSLALDTEAAFATAPDTHSPTHLWFSVMPCERSAAAKEAKLSETFGVTTRSMAPAVGGECLVTVFHRAQPADSFA